METEEHIVSIYRVNSVRVPLQKLLLQGRDTAAKSTTDTIYIQFRP